LGKRSSAAQKMARRVQGEANVLKVTVCVMLVLTPLTTACMLCVQMHVTGTVNVCKVNAFAMKSILVLIAA
jgi:hypothetical protein